ncbi:MAG: branched-chain amino acid ABC transporter permease [Alphaproteobacteria bacterium]|nr:branched-chain amino acid ABC transporter permease [Alphaproteobacteria bacterium]
MMAALQMRFGLGRQSFVGGFILAALVILIGLIVMAAAEKAQIRVANVFFVNLILVLGLQITMGNSNVANLGHITFTGVGAYVAGILVAPLAIKATGIPNAPFGLNTFELHFIPAAMIGVVIGTVLAFLTGLVLTRQTGIAYSIATLALLVIVHTVFTNWVDLTRGPIAFYGIPFKVNTVSLMLIAAACAIVARLFRDSRWGLQLRASGEDVLAAEASGVSVKRLRLVAWTLSGFVLSLGGVMYAYLVGTISPKSFYFDAVFLTLAMLILGGMRSASGAVVGAVIVTLGTELMRWLEGAPVIFGAKMPQIFGLTGFFLGVVIVLFMALRPDGLVGDEELDEMAKRLWRQRKARAAAGEDTGPETSS